MSNKIKITLLLFINIMFYTSKLYSQIEIGYLFGTNFSNMKWDWLDKALEEHGSDLKNRTTFCFGSIFKIDLIKHIDLRFEPMYLSKGTHFKGYYGTNEFDIKSIYFEIPAMLKMNLTESNFQPYLLGGPSIGILLEAGTNDDDIGFCKEALKSTELSMGIGGGISFKKRLNTFFIEGRYNFGLSRLPKEGNADIKNYGIQILGGITFIIKEARK